MSHSNITSSYSLDTGQTDNLYGHASIQLRPGKTPPSGKIAIVFDRFTHSGSGFFTVNSYAGQIGANISGSVSGKTFAVIVPDKDTETGKTEKAESLGIPVLTVDDFKKKR